MHSPENKKIIIVGATSGIGKEMALQYAAKGCIVGITGRREELLNELKQKFSSLIFALVKWKIRYGALSWDHPSIMGS